MQKKGAHGVVVLEGKTVTKTGLYTELLEEYYAYLRLRRLLGEHYSRFFPYVSKPHKRNSHGEFVIEQVGEVNLEELIVDLPLSGETQKVQELLAKALKALWNIFTLTLFYNSVEAHLFLEELVSSLEVSLLQLKLNAEDILLHIHQREHLFTTNLTLSACHRDFSTCNIVVDKECSLKFVDPKWQVQNARVSSVGSIVRDLVTLKINLERRCLELEAKGLSLEYFSLVDAELAHLVELDHCRLPMVILNMAVQYASFATCRCEFCLKPERVFIINEMERRLKECLDELSHL